MSLTIYGRTTAGPEAYSKEQIAYLKQALGIDETILWRNNEGTNPSSSNLAFDTTESPFNFRMIRIYFTPYITHNKRYFSFDPNNATDGITLCDPFKGGGAIIRFPYVQIQCSSTGLNTKGTEYGELSIQVNSVTSKANSMKIYAITGVGRIAGGN